MDNANEVRLHTHEVGVVILTPETDGLNWCLGSRPSRSIGFSIQGEAVESALSERGSSYN